MPTPSAEAIALHPHLAAPVPAGRVRVDCHSHTMWSGDSTTTPEEFEAAVLASGLDVVCVTDHNDVRGAQALAERLPCRVVVGEEVKTHAGELIGLFLTQRIPAGLPAREVAQRIRDQGAIVYVPHPFDPLRRNLSEPVLRELVDAGLIDAMEVMNAKTSLASLNQQARDFALDHGLAAGAGSDAHVPAALGAAYVEMPDFTTPAEFLAALDGATPVGHHSDPARAWRARIVPSTTSR